MIAKRIDNNQNEIVKGLRKCGYSVAITSMIGKGFPDIVVGAKNKNYLFEIKKTTKDKLTEHEEKFAMFWGGQVNIVYCLDDCLEIIK